MATTPNYSWVMPDSTDLVKDLPADFATFGNAVDSTVYSNANAAIAKTLIDAKGDLIVGSAADTAARLAVGTNDYVLTADSTATNGIAWKAAGGAGANWSAVNAGGTSLSGTATTISGISGKDKIMVCVVGASLSSNVSPYLEVRMNGTSTVYYTGGVAEYDGSSITIANSSNWTGTISGIQLNQFASNSAATLGGSVTINGCNGTNYKQFISTGGCYRGSTSFASILNTQGYIENTSTLSSITITTSTGTPSFDAGTVYIFASA